MSSINASSQNLDFRLLNDQKLLLSQNNDKSTEHYQYQPRGIVDDFIGNYQQTFDQLESELANKDNEIRRLNQQIYDMNNGGDLYADIQRSQRSQYYKETNDNYEKRQLENELEEILKENNDLHQELQSIKNQMMEISKEANMSLDKENYNFNNQKQQMQE